VVDPKDRARTREEVPALDRVASDPVHAREALERRQVIEVQGDALVGRPARERRRRGSLVREDERHAEALVVRHGLLPPAMLSPQQPVVRGERDERLGEPPSVGERVEHLADEAVDREQ
jgi:hypothetical protein